MAVYLSIDCKYQRSNWGGTEGCVTEQSGFLKMCHIKNFEK